jgi:hypothetical protein
MTVSGIHLYAGSIMSSRLFSLLLYTNLSVCIMADYTFSLTPSVSLYGSQILLAKLLEVHTVSAIKMKLPSIPQAFFM